MTHLPQIAAFGDIHFNIRKEIAGERTVTLLQELKGPDRVEELAQMLGSATTLTRKSAEEMLRETKATKQKAVGREQ